jgi:hypothetical protein
VDIASKVTYPGQKDTGDQYTSEAPPRAPLKTTLFPPPDVFVTPNTVSFTPPNAPFQTPGTVSYSPPQPPEPTTSTAPTVPFVTPGNITYTPPKDYYSSGKGSIDTATSTTQTTSKAGKNFQL